MLTVSWIGELPAGWKSIASDLATDALGDMHCFVIVFAPTISAANSSPPMRPIEFADAYASADGRGDGDERIVADQVSEAVVDLLEMIRVDEKQRATVGFTARVVEYRKEALAVEEAGHRIAARLLGKPPMRFGKFGMGGRERFVRPAQPCALPKCVGARRPGRGERAKDAHEPRIAVDDTAKRRHHGGYDDQ